VRQRNPTEELLGQNEAGVSNLSQLQMHVESRTVRGVLRFKRGPLAPAPSQIVRHFRGFMGKNLEKT
jgi:hypothetical protein